MAPLMRGADPVYGLLSCSGTLRKGGDGLCDEEMVSSEGLSPQVGQCAICFHVGKMLVDGFSQWVAFANHDPVGADRSGKRTGLVKAGYSLREVRGYWRIIDDHMKDADAQTLVVGCSYIRLLSRRQFADALLTMGLHPFSRRAAACS